MKIKEKMIKLKDKMLDLFFPSDYTCIICENDLPEGKICEKCLEQDIFNNGNRCSVCDSQIKEGNIICDHCKSHKKSFISAHCPLKYNDLTRTNIIKFKSDNAKYLAPAYANLIFQRLVADNVEFDVIIPVPSHIKTIKKRGYNPAKLLADELATLSGKPVLDVLVKTTLTKNQKLLNFKERQNNLENSLTLSKPKLIKGLRVLIVDDILTTGATLNSCAKLMTKAEEVYVCAVARRNI